ncbi:putative pwwp domain-containing protein [Botrytis fragariae]|uniref:Putative pwwp domain-containing protein n=1 Tax=Botrytis fragariae TaxID=1964551 RepID=A0A8H6B3L1_9HELO|nr:putative pwwp domain-containing protein [Botrytis fragariae]KAF5878495.1 putative pwwp domain-containing protein [Botrytis fragariae]
MADEASTRDEVVPPQSPGTSAPDAVVEPQVDVSEGANGSNGVEDEAVSEDPVATSGTSATEEVKSSNAEAKSEKMDEQTIPDRSVQEAPSASTPADGDDAELKGEEQSEDGAPAADESAELADGAASTPASASKTKGRRKSSVPEHKKKLNKKQSKAKLTHTDAKPGDYFYVRLKGYPLWPAIVCDEDMLPSTLIKSRPVTAMRADGTYRSDYEDGGSKAKDRTFPVMYLFTNEFGWIPNYDLLDLDLDTVGDVPNNMRKDLYAAHQLAAEKNDLDYFKTVLTEFMEQKRADEEAKEAAKAAKKAKKEKKEKTPKKAAPKLDNNEDTEMMDVSAIPDDEEVEAPKSTQKKRKNPSQVPEDDIQQPDTAPKKPRIKLNNTPKAANGTSTPKPAKEAKEPKSAKDKSKTKKAAAKTKDAAPVAPPEPELTPEEKRVKKEKEILFLRHKLQKGLLTKDQEPKADEMQQMSEYVNKLEGYADLEVSIIRATKINKVLKAILKLPVIPKEDEFQFKSRSQSLLDKWNRLLASEQVAPATTEAPANGTRDDSKEKDEPKSDSVAANGIAQTDESKTEEKSPALDTPLTALPKEEAASNDDPAPVTEESPEEAEAPAVESEA